MVGPRSTADRPELEDDFEPAEEEIFGSALETHAELRQTCPVAHSSAWNGFWSLLKYDDVVGALRDSSTFITSVQNVVPKLAFTGRRPPLHLDPPEHTPYRKAINPFFSDQKMAEIAPAVRGHVVDILAPLIEAGECDICADFGSRLPMYVFATFFKVPTETASAIKEVGSVFNRAVQNFDDEKVKETSIQLYEIAKGIIESRRENPMDPEDDVTSALMATIYEGNPLPDDLVLGTIRQLLVVGMIAPSLLIGSIIIHLAGDTDLQNKLRQDMSLLPKALEEFLRLYTPYRGFARTANRDVEMGGRLIREDEPIALVYSSANRDEAVFENPDEFDMDRPNLDQHIAFGMGPHQCAGAALARLMLQITFEEILRRTRGWEITDKVEMTKWPEIGPLTCPMRFDPA
jgi:cytochrome P450